MASVEMNGCIRNLPVRYPETAPQKRPAKSVTPAAMNGFHPAWIVRSEKRTAERPRTLPTERSIPPAMITTVIPQASMPITETWRSMSRCVPQEKNAPSALNTIPSAITITSERQARAAGERNMLRSLFTASCRRS
jgi:hypothetical protein